MIFRGLIKSSSIEWPGKIATVVFVDGCNLKCPFCQNIELVKQDDNLPIYTEKDIINLINSKKKWIDGVMISGGEPTLKDPPPFCEKVQQEGFGVGIETNGTNPDMIEKLIFNDLIDYVSLDIKSLLNWEDYKKAIGVNDKKLFNSILYTINVLSESKIDYEFRTTVVPNIINLDDIEILAQYIKDKTDRYYIQQFERRNTLNPKFQTVNSYTQQELETIKRRIENNFEICDLRA